MAHDGSSNYCSGLAWLQPTVTKVENRNITGKMTSSVFWKSKNQGATIVVPKVTRQLAGLLACYSKQMYDAFTKMAKWFRVRK